MSRLKVFVSLVCFISFVRMYSGGPAEALRILQEKGNGRGLDLQKLSLGAVIEELNKRMPDKKIDLTGAQLWDTQFDHSELKNVDFKGAYLRGANFNGAHLIGCNFTQANVQGVSFNSAFIKESNFTDAFFKSEYYQTDKWFISVNFTNAELENVIFNNFEIEEYVKKHALFYK